jgi:hypothetical protein
MGTPTRDDVWLCLHLYEQRREPVLREAREWLSKFTPRSFKDIKAVMDGKVPGDANRFWRQATSYWEMIATLMNSGGISPEGRELFAQTTREWFFFWSKIAPYIEEIRAATRPTAFRNLEAFCRAQPDHDALLEYFAKLNERIRVQNAGRRGRNGAKARTKAKAR